MELYSTQGSGIDTVYVYTVAHKMFVLVSGWELIIVELFNNLGAYKHNYAVIHTNVDLPPFNVLLAICSSSHNTEDVCPWWETVIPH